MTLFVGIWVVTRTRNLLHTGRVKDHQKKIGVADDQEEATSKARKAAARDGAKVVYETEVKNSTTTLIVENPDGTTGSYVARNHHWFKVKEKSKK